MHTADPFLFQLFLIFVWAKLFGEIFEQLHMPAVLGEILAGVVIGPYGARLVVPDFKLVTPTPPPVRPTSASYVFACVFASETASGEGINVTPPLEVDTGIPSTT